MNELSCQAVCSLGCQISEHLGAVIALVIWSVLTTALALRARVRIAQERDKRHAAEAEVQVKSAEVQAKSAEVQAKAAEAASAAAEAAVAHAQADFWREKSMRPGRMPSEPVELELQTATTFADGDEEPPSDGTRWLNPLSDAPGQFEQAPTEPGKRKPR